jgi:hypothetical protein
VTGWLSPEIPSTTLKLFSLARCLKISLEELLLSFGIDVNELRRGNNNRAPGLGPGSELEAHEPDFGLRLNFEAGFENQETCLLRLRPIQMVGIFPPQLQRYIDPNRYRYAVIGTEDDTMGDLIPPRSLVVQKRREPLGPDSTPAGLEARSPHILASMFRWDDWVSRIPESEGPAWLAR